MQESITIPKKEIVYDLDEMDGHEFEAAVEEVFRRIGYQTERGKRSNDHGRDIVLRRGEQVAVVECKHQRSAVGRPIIQKLHSATLTYRDARQGFVVTSGRFAPSAREYVIGLNDVSIVLWDYERLSDEARSVGVYFRFSASDTHIFFHLPWRTESEIRDLLLTRHISGIRSNPRSASLSIQMAEIAYEIVPGLLIEHSVDKVFQTQAGTIYTANDTDRMIIGLGPDAIKAPEQQFWVIATPMFLTDRTVDSRDPATYFGNPTSAMVAALKNKTAARLTRNIKYVGRNNQVYWKLCEVKPEDVAVQVKNVLYARWKIGFCAGPRKYEANFADDRSRYPSVTDTKGFLAGAEGFILGNGLLCNDCGLISPLKGKTAGSACKVCGRTLCHAHGWNLPAFRFRRPEKLCSICYMKREQASTEFSVRPVMGSYVKTALLGVLPGLPQLMMKQYSLSAVFFALLVGASIAVSFRYPEPIVLLILLSMCESLNWTRRIRLHKTNLEQLSTYCAEWE